MSFFIDFKILKSSILNTIEDTEIKNDSSEPYEFIDFIKNIITDNLNNEFVVDAYNKYLIAWTTLKNQTSENFDEIRKQKYVDLLQNIQLNYLNQDELRILGNIDWDNDLEIEIAIPFFVEKIKDIIEKYINKRRDVKNSKSNWATKGSQQFLRNFISQYIIDNYTKNENTFQKYKQTYQNLESFQKNFNFNYEGLYDLNDYRSVEFDINPDSFLSSDSDYDLTSLSLTSFSDYTPDKSKIISELKKDLYKKYISIDHSYYNGLSSYDVNSNTPFYDPYNYDGLYISKISKTDNLLRSEDIGYYFTSKYSFTSNYFSPFGISTSLDLNGLLPKIDVYRGQNYKDYYSWSKYNSTIQGIYGKPVFNKHLKRFYGYQSRDLNIDDSVGGVERYTDNIQLWGDFDNEKWSNEDVFDKYDNNILNRDSKNEYFFNLGDNESVYKYICDIYGNQYYLIKEINTPKSSNVNDNIYMLTNTVGNNDLLNINFKLLGQRPEIVSAMNAIKIDSFNGNDIVLGFSLSKIIDDNRIIDAIDDYNLIDLKYYPLLSDRFDTEKSEIIDVDSKKSIYENQYTQGKLYIRDVSNKCVKTIGSFLDDTFDIDNKLLNVDIVDDFIIITTNDKIITGKIQYDFSKSDLIFNELNKYDQVFYNDHTYKSASYWLDSANKNVIFADIDHKNDDIEIYYINSQTNQKTIYKIDNSDIDFDYNNLISFKYISKPQIIKNSNDIYLITLISDICENYYYQIIKYNLISKNEIKSIYNRIYHPSKLNINKNIKDEPEDSRVDILESFYSDDKLYTNSIIYRWDNETDSSLEYNLTYAPYVKETYYDNDVKYNIDKYKPSLNYLLSDLVQNITPVENGGDLDKKYTFNGENIYAPIDILMDFRDINDFDSYISRSEPIYKIEYHINGKIQTHHITYDGDVEIEEKYFDTGISVDDLGDGDSNTGVIQISFEPFGVDNTSSYRTDVTYPQGVMLFT